ncbi:hypothetical protein DFH07DRAFT_979737 [Mycena maculata]|uniref:Transmembrane protein n=1 Tax=Mycena maculata TaxID=230809 RepID=A0AAD7N2M8_9AGAR|nr:hypothetical protein DFH07DRAFT_979737 [Mycena maculata]
MLGPAILFNPTLRVYNLRVLLVSNVAIMSCALLLPGLGWQPEGRLLGLATCSFVTLHHIGILFGFCAQRRGLAALDLTLILVEIVFSGYVFSGTWIFWGTLISFVPQWIALAVSAVLRCATIIHSKEGFFRQRFCFLGGCILADPPYTPASILLNRSISRPLIRGESMTIIFTRAVIINCVAIGISAFAIYSILVVPSTAGAYIRSIVVAQMDSDYTGGVSVATNFPYGKISIEVDPMNDPSDTSVSQMKGYADGNPCELIESGISCGDVLRNITISMVILGENTGVYVWVIPSAPPPIPLSMLRGVTGSLPTMLFPSSDLVGFLTWTERRLLLTDGVGLVSPIPDPLTRDAQSYVSTFIPEVTGLQPYPSQGMTPGVSKLTLILYGGQAVTKILQDTVADSALSGIATVGGFWTFVNGAFAVIFGANIVYFAFGHRPLSALGVIHIFQRRSLIRRWHEDFPALNSEGGRPGSESAGIVAFIRERLINTEDPQSIADQTSSGTEARRSLSDSPTRSGRESPSENVKGIKGVDREFRSRHSGYLLDAGYRLHDDEFPLMDMDLGEQTSGGMVEVQNWRPNDV